MSTTQGKSARTQTRKNTPDKKSGAVIGRIFFLDAAASGRVMSANPDGSDLKSSPTKHKGSRRHSRRYRSGTYLLD